MKKSNPRFGSLEEWLSWLASQQIVRSPQEALLAAKSVLSRLQLTLIQPVITVTGTNGKGSCVALLESIYQAQGYLVGAYISPHLIQFNERIHINGQCVSDKDITSAFEIIDQMRGEIPLTYFQFATLAAVYLFNQYAVDCCILEIGIGGQWDVVNLIEPTLSVITSIDLDHCEILGETRELIAIQKAGVMRREKPTICGDPNPPASLLDEANRIGAKLSLIDRDYFYEQLDEHTWVWKTKKITRDHLPIPSLLLTNAATALMAIDILKTIFPIKIDAIKQGLMHASLLGRFQRIQKNGITIVFDVAHNPAAAVLLLNQIQKLSITGQKIAICGMLNDKDVLNTLKPFVNEIDEWYIVSLEGTRGLSAQAIENTLEKLGGLKIQCYDTAQFAYQGAMSRAKAGDLVIVFGSFRLVGECQKILQ